MKKMVFRLRLMFRRAIRTVKRINARHNEWETKHPIESSIIGALVGGIIVALCVLPDVCESPLLALLIMVVDVLLGLVFGIVYYCCMRWKKGTNLTKRSESPLGVVIAAAVFGLLAAYIGIGSIDGPMPKDDDLCVQQAHISDDQNVMAALREIVGHGHDDAWQSNLIGRVAKAAPGFGGIHSSVCDEPYMGFVDDELCVPFTIENEEGKTIATVSNSVELLALVDAAIATNECIVAAIRRAAERPYYVLADPYHCEFIDIFNLHTIVRVLYGVRHARFIETKQYDEAIKDDRTLLDLADKIMQGKSWMIDSMNGFYIHAIAVGRLAEIAVQEDVDAGLLAEIYAVLSKYDINDWKSLCHAVVRGEYSFLKSALADYSACSWLKRIQWWGTCFVCRENKLSIPFVSFMPHPHHILSNFSAYYRSQLALLDDYDVLVARAKSCSNRGNALPKCLRKCLPNFMGEYYMFFEDVSQQFVNIAETANRHRANRLLVACRRHFHKTGKLPETVEDISPEFLQGPIIDPMFNAPYAIKTWRDEDMVSIAVFQKNATGVIVPHETIVEYGGLDDSPGKGCLAYLRWPENVNAMDGAKNEKGEVRHYKHNAYDYYTFTKDGVEWAYEITSDGDARLGYREKWGKVHHGRRHGAIVGEIAGSVAVPSEICGREVVGINAGGFAGCTNITSITIPEGVRMIGRGAFLDCDRLERIICLGSPDCDSEAPIFDGCKSLRGITVRDDGGMNPLVKKAYMECQSLADAHGFAVYQGRLIKYFGEDGDIAVPSAVRRIEDMAFCDCTNLTSVTIPECVKEIGRHAFAGCRRLKQIKFLGDMPKNIINRNGRLILFDRDINMNKDRLVIKARKGSKGWGWKARLFGKLNGFRIEFDETGGNDDGNGK